MDPITLAECVMSLCGLCERAIAAGRTVRRVLARRLSQRERALLVEAADDGVFFVVKSDAFGVHVASSGRQFAEQDPSVTAHYVDAFTSLCARGLIIPQGGRKFRLTGQGFDLARGLRDKAERRLE